MGLVRRIYLTLTLLVGSVPCVAQDPFSELEFHLQGSQNLGPNVLDGQWQMGRGAKVSVSTPFYLGNWDMNFAIHRFNALSDVPGFGALWVSSGWGINVRLHPRLTIKPSLSIGNYRMSFDDSTTTFSGESSESDFVGSLAMLISFDVGRRWFLYSQAEYLMVQTTPRINLWFLSTGIGFRVPTGKHIKAILE